MIEYFDYQVPKLNGYYHGEGKIQSNYCSFQGTWDKGLRVNTGIYEIDGNTLKVQFKKGKIHRLLESKKKFKSKILWLNQIYYIKEGNYFKEDFKNDLCYFFVYNDQILFHGYPKTSDYMQTFFFNKIDIHTNISIFSNSQDFTYGPFHISSRSLNYIPVGPCRVSISDNFYIKGSIIGYFFIGRCKIIKGSLKLIFESCMNKPPEALEVTSSEYGINLKINRINETLLAKIIKDSHQASSEVRPFIHESFLLLENVFNLFKGSPFLKTVILNSIQPKESWIKFETNLKNQPFWIPAENSERKKCSEMIECKERDDKRKFIRIRYSDGSKYFGESRNGVRHGLGCLVFPDQSKFQGYFKDDHMMGKGKLYTSRFQFKGIFMNDRVEKVLSFLKVEV